MSTEHHTLFLTVAQALREAQGKGLERIDAQMLLLHTLGQPLNHRAWLLTHDTDPMTAESLAQFRGLYERRLAGEPTAYLTGVKEFWGLPLQIDARVLDPRADTETLVSWALETIAPIAQPRIVDLGTGSGAIALAIQSERPDATVLAIDASADALAVAQANAERLQLPVQFAQRHWLQSVEQGPFDLIVSNPPYIAAADPHLQQGDLRFEPAPALASGADGLDAIREIISGAPGHLVPGGWLLLEHGWDQGAAIRALLEQAGFGDVETVQDLEQRDRVTLGRLHG